MKADIYLTQERAEQYLKLAELPAAALHEICDKQQWIPGRRSIWTWPLSELDILIHRHGKKPPDAELVMSRFQRHRRSKQANG